MPATGYVNGGEAGKEDGIWWSYTATEAVPAETTVRVDATARDRPGGTGAHAVTAVV